MTKTSIDQDGVRALVWGMADLFSAFRCEVQDPADRILAVNALRGAESFCECYGRMQWAVEDIPLWIDGLADEEKGSANQDRQNIRGAIAKLCSFFLVYQARRDEFDRCLRQWAQERATAADAAA